MEEEKNINVEPTAEQTAPQETASVETAPQETSSEQTNPLAAIPEMKDLEEVIQREAVEEQDTTSSFSISRTLGGVIIARAVQKQMWLVLLISLFLIIYISNRYVCQKKMVEIDRLETKLVEARYKAIVCTSILTQKSRESNIMTLLGAYGDSTLAIPQDPPYLIKVEEEN